MIPTIPILFALLSAVPGATDQDMPGRFLVALAKVEGGPRMGDHGRAIGPFQIRRGYWHDAIEQRPALAVQGYASCTNWAYASQVVLAYAERHARVAWSTQNYARVAMIHHAGPTGARQGRGREFGRRVLNLMNVKKTIDRPAVET